MRILGPVEVSGPPPLEEGRADLAVELAVYLATHPDGVHPVVLGGILWPRGVQSVVRDATIARVAAWLGSDAAGRPNLFTDEAGRLRLGPGCGPTGRSSASSSGGPTRTRPRAPYCWTRRSGWCADRC
nr:hypothetical protein GCM10020093_091510 [Planobispora longispora]